MKYTGITYRPPFEANSLLLQVTTGCSHNKCTFCTMYRNIPFKVESMEQIEKDLNEARHARRRIRRVFLVNGDAFVLSADKLKEIAKKIIEIIPEVETIAMYSSVKNIMDKSDEELKDLRDLRINDLNIGIESGLEDAVKFMNKGYTVEDTRRELKRLEKAGIDYSVNIIIVCGGSSKSRENATYSAELVNELNPSLIFVGSVHIDPGSELEKAIINGEFDENTLRENIEEEKLFLECLDKRDIEFFGLHPSNAIRVHGILSKDKEEMIEELEEGLREIPDKFLDRRSRRGAEGSVEDFLGID